MFIAQDTLFDALAFCHFKQEWTNIAAIAMDEVAEAMDRTAISISSGDDSENDRDDDEEEGGKRQGRGGGSSSSSRSRRRPLPPPPRGTRPKTSHATAKISEYEDEEEKEDGDNVQHRPLMSPSKARARPVPPPTRTPSPSKVRAPALQYSMSAPSPIVQRPPSIMAVSSSGPQSRKPSPEKRTRFALSLESETGEESMRQPEDKPTLHPAVVFHHLRDKMGTVVGNVSGKEMGDMESGRSPVHALGSVVDRWLDLWGYPASFAKNVYYARVFAKNDITFANAMAGALSLNEARWLFPLVEVGPTPKYRYRIRGAGVTDW